VVARQVGILGAGGVDADRNDPEVLFFGVVDPLRAGIQAGQPLEIGDQLDRLRPGGLLLDLEGAEVELLGVRSPPLGEIESRQFLDGRGHPRIVGPDFPLPRLQHTREQRLGVGVLALSGQPRRLRPPFREILLLPPRRQNGRQPGRQQPSGSTRHLRTCASSTST
jgi:hypothetical protein